MNIVKLIALIAFTLFFDVYGLKKNEATFYKRITFEVAPLVVNSLILSTHGTMMGYAGFKSLHEYKKDYVKIASRNEIRSFRILIFECFCVSLYCYLLKSWFAYKAYNKYQKIKRECK